MIKNRLLRAITVAGFSAGMLIAAGANAGYTQLGMAALEDGFPLSMEDWIANPTKYSWNPKNVRRGNHPDRPDGVVYIFKTETDANNWWNGIGTPRDGIPDTAVAYVHWELDNKSGKFPGIMSISDDPDFKMLNCIMSSGYIIPEDGGQTKTCGNGPGTSKRFKLVILKADEHIDLVFNTREKDLIYENFSIPAVVTDPLVEPDITFYTIEDNIFRNYRYLIKVGNGTGTDTVAGPRTGTRLAGIKVELGFGIDTAFDPSDGETIDGLAYELTECVPDRYWDMPVTHKSGPTDTCLAGTVEVWLDEEFATFSPSMYAPLLDDRNPNGGYWDKKAAGMFPPDKKQDNLIDSGDKTDNTTGIVGAITSNYFDMVANQAVGANMPDYMFGYMMYYGVFAEGDPGNLPMGLYKDDDGDPATEGELYAWWDGSNYRWGIDRDHDGVVGPDAWGIVSDAELAEMVARPLHPTVALDPPRYEVAYMDDLAGLNVDTFIKITPDFDTDKNETFTVRLTGQSIATAGITAGDIGTADGNWVTNPATALPVPDVPVDPVDPDAPVTSGGGSSGFSLSWITAGLLALGLLLRRRRFQKIISKKKVT